MKGLPASNRPEVPQAGNFCVQVPGSESSRLFWNQASKESRHARRTMTEEENLHFAGIYTDSNHVVERPRSNEIVFSRWLVPMQPVTVAIVRSPSFSRCQIRSPEYRRDV